MVCGGQAEGERGCQAGPGPRGGGALGRRLGGRRLGGSAHDVAQGGECIAGEDGRARRDVGDRDGDDTERGHAGSTRGTTLGFGRRRVGRRRVDDELLRPQEDIAHVEPCAHRRVDDAERHGYSYADGARSVLLRSGLRRVLVVGPGRRREVGASENRPETTDGGEGATGDEVEGEAARRTDVGAPRGA